MPQAVIESKLRAPRARKRVVPRPRLEELLDRSAHTTVTLVAAPAGFGKTTLLSTWLAGDGVDQPSAWVSLDERDQDPMSFWTYLLHAVDRAVPGSATAALAELTSGHAEIEDVASTLLNELGVTSRDLTLVLDDYHLAEAPGGHPGLGFFLDHLPPQVHVVISTRVDPALPLARLRARGELVEIRATDLRFNSDEASAYLNEVNALCLEPAEVAALESRTEGWAAALQLAALSLEGHEDRAGFISGFAGDDRFVVDYLADEVLDHQPADVRAFLLETSVLEALTGPLCDAVTGRDDGRAMLESLERKNLFLVPLDDRRRWYRYHHLFADVLQVRLLDERPAAAPELHRRASAWYQSAGKPEAAVRHALAAGDVDYAADLVEAAIPDLLRERREPVIRRWVEELPRDIVRNRPVLAVGFIGGLMSDNQFEGIAQRLDAVEELLSSPATDVVVVDRAEHARLPAAVQIYRAAYALVTGDLSATVRHAELALHRAGPEDDLSHASAAAILGLASWTTGNLQAAHAAYRDAVVHLERAGHVADVLGCSITLADIEITHGRLGDARRTFENGLALAGDSLMRGVADMYVGLSRVAWEQGDLASAATWLGRADEAGDPYGLPQNPYRWRVMMARLRHASGDTGTAVELLDEAERVFVSDFLPNVQPIAAMRARLLVASGDLAGARAWADARGLTADDELSYLTEYEHLTLARILLQEGRTSEANTLLAAVVAAARKAGRTGTVIEALVLVALAGRADGDLDAATATLAEALELAEPEGFVRPIVDERRTVRELLENLTRGHHDNAFARSLLGRLSGTELGGEVEGDAQTASSKPPPTPALADPLSSREVDVLRLLASDLSGPDIARRLHVSLATVRTHTQHIYSKLGVNNRRAAVRRAHQLDLFPRAGH